MYSVLFVESGTAGGGSFESLYQHLRVINRQRFRPVVVYLNKNRFVEPVKELGIPVYVLTDWLYSLHAPRYAALLLKQIAFRIEKHLPGCSLEFARLVHVSFVHALEHIVREEKIDILHLNDHILRDLSGLFVAEKTGTVCISHLRSRPRANLGRRLVTYANLVVSAYIANSKTTKRCWEEKGIDVDRSWLVYNGIPPLCVEPVDVRRVWGGGSSVRFAIGCVARLVWWKGHSFLMRAFSRLARAYPDSILLIVGDGAMRKELADKAHTLGMDGQVIFTGYQSRAQEIIAGLDLLVLPSFDEPFGRVLLEAMQVGTPVVATSSGGIPEIVTHEQDGLLVDYDDDEALYEAMERVLTDKPLRSKLIENGRRTVRERFSIERYASEVEHIYESVLDRRCTPQTG